MNGKVIAVNRSISHTFSKVNVDAINLIVGKGVEGDAHCGVRVKHRSRVIKDPTQPNLRQVHLIHVELFEELSAKGFEVKVGDLGENVTTKGIDLLALPRNTVLKIGQFVKIQITGLRNPCKQLDGFQNGLMKAVLDKDHAGNLIRKAGIMGIVLKGGTVTSDDSIEIIFPEKPYLKLERV